MTPGMTTPPTDGTDAETRSNDHGDLHADDRSVLSVIGDIQRGAIDAKSLCLEDRRRCVVHLTSEGYSAAETAQILKVHERTIARDRAVIRRANSIERDPEMIGEMVGQLVTQADTCLQHIRRVTRERDTPPNVRVEGEKACWIIARDLVKCLQSLGYPKLKRHPMSTVSRSTQEFARQKISALRREAGQKQIITFAKTYLPAHFRLEPSPMHIELLAALQQASRQRGARLAIAAPRGHAKADRILEPYAEEDPDRCTKTIPRPPPISRCFQRRPVPR